MYETNSTHELLQKTNAFISISSTSRRTVQKRKHNFKYNLNKSMCNLFLLWKMFEYVNFESILRTLGSIQTPSTALAINQLNDLFFILLFIYLFFNFSSYTSIIFYLYSNNNFFFYYFTITSVCAQEILYLNERAKQNRNFLFFY